MIAAYKAPIFNYHFSLIINLESWGHEISLLGAVAAGMHMHLSHRLPLFTPKFAFIALHPLFSEI